MWEETAGYGEGSQCHQLSLAGTQRQTWKWGSCRLGENRCQVCPTWKRSYVRGGCTDAQCPVSLSPKAHVASKLGAPFSEPPSDLADRFHWSGFVFFLIEQARWGRGLCLSSPCISLSPPPVRKIQFGEPKCRELVVSGAEGQSVLCNMALIIQNLMCLWLFREPSYVSQRLHHQCPLDCGLLWLERVLSGQRDWILAAGSQQQGLTLVHVDVSWGCCLLPARRLMCKSGFKRPPDNPPRLQSSRRPRIVALPSSVSGDIVFNLVFLLCGTSLGSIWAEDICKWNGLNSCDWGRVSL